MPYNCHVHLFSVRNLPDAFYGFPGFAYLADRPWVLNPAVYALDKITRLTGNDNQRRMIAFAKVGMKQTQREVFTVLREAYGNDSSWKYVVLTMDMDHMNAGKARENFYAQIQEIVDLQKEYPTQIIGFVGYDPRNGDALQTTIDCITNKHFYGIKLYPPLGFFPSDYRMEQLYAYATENEIPLMTHCDIGGIHYQAHAKWGFIKNKKKINEEHRNPITFCELPNEIKQSIQANVPYSCFRYNFSNPLNYFPVLEKFPKLKICLAHAGGSIYMDHNQSKINQKKCIALGTTNWFEHVKQLMAYENVYTDVSYTLFEHNVFDEIIELINNYPDKVLFGTDFFMTEKETPEKKLVHDFRLAIGENRWKKLAEENPRKYLTSKIHTNIP